MDVVYVCRRGENQELKYSLRSLTNVQHDRVWLFGGSPTWVRNVTLVTTPQRGTKYAVTTNAVLEACLHPGVSDPFWLWNDDFYAIEKAKPEHHHRGTVRDVLEVYERDHPDSRYTTGMRATLAVLEREGHHDPLSYELHVPLIVHKEPMIDSLALGEGVDVWHKRTAYGAVANLGGAYMDDVKVYDTSAQATPTGTWLSSCDASIATLRPWLHRRWPKPCEYEA